MIHGFDLSTKEFIILEHTHRDNLNYGRNQISFEALKEAYLGGLKNFELAGATYLEIENARESKLYGLSEEKRIQFFKETLSTNISDMHEELFKGLKQLKVFIEIYSIIITNESRLQENAPKYVETLNHIINGKTVEKYRIEQIFGIHESCYLIINEILELWKEVRMYLVKYLYSDRYDADALKQSLMLLDRIFQKEEEFIHFFLKNQGIKK